MVRIAFKADFNYAVNDNSGNKLVDAAYFLK